jgi:hypothetical protein
MLMGFEKRGLKKRVIGYEGVFKPPMPPLLVEGGVAPYPL